MFLSTYGWKNKRWHPTADNQQIRKIFFQVVTQKNHFNEVGNSRMEGRKEGAAVYWQMCIIQVGHGVGHREQAENPTSHQVSHGVISYSWTNLSLIIALIPVRYRALQIPGSSMIYKTNWKKQSISLLNELEMRTWRSHFQQTWFFPGVPWWTSPFLKDSRKCQRRGSR